MKEKIDAMHRQIIQLIHFILETAVKAFSMDKDNWLNVLNDTINVFQKLYQLPAELLSLVPETKDNTFAFAALRQLIDDMAQSMFSILKGSDDKDKAWALIYLAKQADSLPRYVENLLPSVPEQPEEEDRNEQL